MDKKIEKATESLILMYEDIENELLNKIVSHFSINEEFLNSDYWRIKKLEEMGLFNEEVVEYLAKETKSTKSEILKALNDIGIKVTNYQKYKKLFDDGLIKINPDILIDNYTISNIIKTAYNELTDTFIQMSNKIELSTKTAYLNVVESAYLKTSMGTHSYQEAIREAINDLSNKGLTVLTYQTIDENGNVTGIKNYDIEATVRREVLTNTRKLSNEISMEIANELKSEYVYLSEHLACRPTHFPWQGTIIKREDLTKITHYGEVDGLGGINCRHYFEPYYGDNRGNELKKYTEEETEQAYNLSQQQRYLERGVRKWKRKAEMFKSSGDLELYSKAKDKTKEWQLRVKEFTEQNNLKRDFTREYIVENSQNENGSVDVTNQWLKNATPKSHEVKEREYFIDKQGNKYEVDGKNVVLDYSDDEKQCAIWLENTFGGEIYMNPKVNFPKGINTADYLWRDELWDKKSMKKSVSLTRAFDNAIKDHENQASNFILDLTDCKLNDKTILFQVKNAFNPNNKLYRNWLQKVIVKRNEKLISVIVKE